jgi:hypothetical protein
LFPAACFEERGNMLQYLWYQNQKNWKCENWSELHDILSKILLIAIDDKCSKLKIRDNAATKKNEDLLKSMDLSKMSYETKAIMYCILQQQKALNIMVEYFPNLSELLNVKPLMKPLYIRNNPLNLYKEYIDMNIFK